MAEISIILFAIWTYPVVGFFLFKLTKNRLELRKNILKIVAFLSVIAILGLLTNVSTTLSAFDWFIATMPFLLLCSLLWWTQFQKKAIIKYSGTVALFLTFTIVYALGTVGILGVGFVVGDLETDREVWFENGLIYKEYSIGNATSDYRGKRFEINRTFEWLPLIEWRVKSKKFLDLEAYRQEINVKYDQSNNEFLLEAEEQRDDSTYLWSTRINLDE